MQYRTFGKSDLKVSAIGFGGWPMGRGHYGSFVENEIIAAVHRASDLGITLFDTAQVYGWGAGEELMGRALKGRRDKVVIVTKTGLHWDPAHPDQRPARDSSKEFMNTMLEGSLKRLQTDYIDLLLVHWPDESRPYSEPMEVFAKWKEQGKIRHGGVSNFTVPMMDECLKHFPIITNQVGYNLFDRRPEAEVIPFCKSHGMGIMAYGSLSYGLLTGAMTPDTRFSDDDWRRSLVAFGQPIFQGEHFLRNLKVVDRLKEIAAGYGKAVAQLAVAWVLSNPVVTVALTGARKPSEIEENVVAADWKLPAKARKEIEAAFTAS
jgi:aryl-alcohol dehydrogenase-like predicted oxidoreductase